MSFVQRRVELVNEQVSKLQVYTGVYRVWLADAGFVPNGIPARLGLLILYAN